MVFLARSVKFKKCSSYLASLVFQFNQTDPNDYASRSIILQELLGFIGKDSFIETPFRCDWGKHIRIGNNTFINYNCV